MRVCERGSCQPSSIATRDKSWHATSREGGGLWPASGLRACHARATAAVTPRCGLVRPCSIVLLPSSPLRCSLVLPSLHSVECVSCRCGVVDRVQCIAVHRSGHVKSATGLPRSDRRCAALRAIRSATNHTLLSTTHCCAHMDDMQPDGWMAIRLTPSTPHTATAGRR